MYLLSILMMAGCYPGKEYIDGKFKEIDRNQLRFTEDLTVYGKVFSESRNGTFGIIKIDVTSGDNTFAFLFLDPENNFDKGDYVKFMPAYYDIGGKRIGYAVSIESISEYKFKKGINYRMLTNLDLHGMFDHHDQNHVRGHVNNKTISLIRDQNRPMKIAEIDGNEFAFYATFDPLGCPVDSVFYIPSRDSISTNNGTFPLIKEIACNHDSLHE